MSGGPICSTFLLVYVLILKLVTTNSRISTIWRLNSEERITEASPFNGLKQLLIEDDPVFKIITSTVHFGHVWVKGGVERYCSSCETIAAEKENVTNFDDENILDCGKPVNFTYYDNLVGVMNRDKHPNVLEPQVTLVLTKSKRSDRGIEYDIDTLERKLRKARKHKSKPVQLYNQIGNLWRIKGNPQKAIECYRWALSISPHNSEVLLNLARVLFTLQYLDDAIFLTRRSLEAQPSDKGAWQQYFTLGEILKAYGHYQDAVLHLRHALELRPGFEPAQIALRELEVPTGDTMHVYTMVIIVCLVLGVILVVMSSFDSPNGHGCNEAKPHRHFNKAMAMRSLRGLGISQRNLKSKKLVL